MVEPQKAREFKTRRGDALQSSSDMRVCFLVTLCRFTAFVFPLADSGTRTLPAAVAISLLSLFSLLSRYSIPLILAIGLVS